MQHNHTKAIHGHIGIGDAISDVFCLKFKRHQRFFNGAQRHSTAHHAAGGDCQWDERHLGCVCDAAQPHQRHPWTYRCWGCHFRCFCLKFKRHQRLFNDGHGMCTACRRRSHGPPHQRTDLPPGAPQTILSTSRGMLEVAITLVRPTQHPSWHFVTTRVQNLHKRAIREHKRGGNGGSCGLITRQNAPLAPVSIARHHDTSAQPPAAPFRPCLLYTSPSPRDRSLSRMPSSA